LRGQALRRSTRLPSIFGLGGPAASGQVSRLVDDVWHVRVGACSHVSIYSHLSLRIRVKLLTPGMLSPADTRSKEGAMLRNILVPLDGSDLAERALPYAVSLAKGAPAKLTLLRATLAHTIPGIDPGSAQLAATQ